MARLGKTGKIRLAMVLVFTLMGAAGLLVTATPYLEGEASANKALSYRPESEKRHSWLSPRLAFADIADTLATNLGPEPAESEVGPSRGRTDDPSFEGLIDWEGLSQLNPDVIGWVSVPGTRVDYAIVQANPNDPQHYLTYDIRHRKTPYGCPYLDADAAAEGGLDALFPIIYGHHLINGKMFSDFAKFSDADYAREHARILIETPKELIELSVIAVNVVNADEELIQTRFANAEELNAYLRERIAESEVVIEEAPATYDQVFCFVTCSYGSDNERTLIYAAPL